MNWDSLRHEVAIQLNLLDTTVREVELLRLDLAARLPTTRELAAAAAFLSDFYSGVENILKRVSRAYGVPLPSGDAWHIELFHRFCEPGHPPLPIFFDADQRQVFAAYRRFRHVVHHGYVLQLDWHRMAEGVKGVAAVYAGFKSAIGGWIETSGLDAPPSL